jgi:hypothetical protein
MRKTGIVNLLLHFTEDEHKALSKIKDDRSQTWEDFVLGMARETGEYIDPT